MNPVTVKTTHEIPKLVKTLVYVYSRNGTSIIMADISLPFAPVNSHKPLLCEEVIQINGKFPHNETENSLKVFTRFYFVLFFTNIQSICYNHCPVWRKLTACSCQPQSGPIYQTVRHFQDKCEREAASYL